MNDSAKQLTIKYAFLNSTFWIGECCTFSFAAVFLQSKNFSNIQIGLIMSLASILCIILQPIIAAFADKSQKISIRYIIISIMFVILGLALILKILPDSFLLISVIYVTINALEFTLVPLFNSMAVEYINKGIYLNYGLARGIGSVSFAVMSSILGIAVNHFGPGIILTIFLICHCLSIISAYSFKLSNNITVTGIVHNPSEQEKDLPINSDKLNDKASSPAGIFSFFSKYKKFSLLLLGIVLLFYAHSVINTYLINIVENVGGDSADMGISLSIAAALELPAMAAFIFIVKKIKCSTLIKISAFFFLIKSGTAFLARNIYMIHFSMIFQMLSYAIYTPASVFYVNTVIDEKDKVKGQSMIGLAAGGIAGTIANVTGGKLLDSVGVSYLLLIGTLITAAGFIIILFSAESTKIKKVH